MKSEAKIGTARHDAGIGTLRMAVAQYGSRKQGEYRAMMQTNLRTANWTRMVGETPGGS